jgi:enoyl-CoA hydratase/carnithine racemase
MEEITTEQSEHVVTITMNRPDKKNAVNQAMYARMVELFEQAESDENIRVVVLRGAGGNFTSGNDLGEFQQVPEERDEPIAAYEFLRTVAFFEKPLISEVSGHAVGLGATVLLHSDLVLASEDARIKFPFVDLGVVPEAGSSLLLPRMVGHQKAAEIIFPAKELSAAEGRDAGFVNRVVPKEDLRDEVREQSRELAGKAPTALRETKRLMKEPYWDKLSETIDRETEVFHDRLLSEESAEAIAATLEGREPDFSETGSAER